eukprot:1733995-Pleurochrysis_carterae.AAC.3
MQQPQLPGRPCPETACPLSALSARGGTLPSRKRWCCRDASPVDVDRPPQLRSAAATSSSEAVAPTCFARTAHRH